MLEDCVKYVLSQPYPAKIIDIDAYLTQMGEQDYDRNHIAIEVALSELPENYKTELMNRMFGAYIIPTTSSVFRSNVEFAAPILWKVLTRDVKQQLARRVDQEIIQGNGERTALAFACISHVQGQLFLTTIARKYLIGPIVTRLTTNLDNWAEEAVAVRELSPYAPYVPDELLDDYVTALTLTYVGHTGYSSRYARSDFYSNAAASYIPDMFQSFDDRAAGAFANLLRTSLMLKSRIRTPSKLARLRNLGGIVAERASVSFPDRSLLLALADPANEAGFFTMIG